MKIAVASMGEMVAGHFGHCENFNIFEAENGKIISEENIPNPGHKPGFLPNFLHEKGVNIIISGGMGGGAIEIFDSHNIDVVTGANGNAKKCTEQFLAGSLKSNGSVCNHHEHADECEEH